MPRTKPPCYNDGNDCPRRKVGCRQACAEWAAWESAHKADREQYKKHRAQNLEVDTFLSEQNKRVSEKRHYEYNRKYQMTHRRNDNT
jgi:hypothetical protein